MLTKGFILKVFGANFFGLLVTYLISFFTPLTWWLIAIGFFVVADFITGVIKANKEGNKIISKKLFNTIPKFAAYAIAVILAHVLSLLFFQDFPAIKLISGFIAFIEVKSIDENIHAITGHSLFSDLIKMLNPKRDKKK